LNTARRGHDMETPPSSESARKRSRQVGYLLTFVATFSLGTTEIFAPWYAGILGGSPYIIGWAMGSFGLVYMFSPYLGGRVSDRIGRRNTLLLATLWYVVLLTIYPQPFVTPELIVAIRAVEGVVFGLFYPTVEALVAEMKPEAQSVVLGNFSVSWSSGMILSPFVIAFMSTNFGNVTSIYVVLLIELVSLLLIAGLVKGGRPVHVQATERAESVRIKPQGSHKTSRRFIASYLSMALFGFTSTVILGLFPSYIDAQPGLGTEDFGYLLVVWNSFRTLGFYGSTKVPKEKMESVMITGIFLIAGSLGVVYVTTSLPLLYAAMIISGLGVGFAYISSLYVVVSATESEKGEHAGLIESLAGIGFFVGPIFGGWIAEYALNLPYLATCLFAAICFIIVLWLLRREKQS